MEKICNAIKCPNCSKILSQPVLLPCSHSICKAHTANNMPTLICFKCGEQHSNGNFVLNEALADLIAAQIDSLDFGKWHKEAKNSCERLEDVISQIDCVLKDSDCYVHETVSELKRRVHLKKEEIQVELDKKTETVLARLDDYESKCKQDPKTNNQALNQAKQAARNELDQWLSALDELKFDEDKWKNIMQQSEKKVNSLSERLTNFKASILKADQYKALRREVESIEKIDIDYFFNISSKLNSTIIKEDMQKEDLLKLCEFKPSQKFTLLYRGSRDGFKAKDFHSRCDNKWTTLTIIKTTKGYIFGGYTQVFWNDPNEKNNTNEKSLIAKPARDPNAFLFSLLNREHQPIKMKVVRGQECYAIARCPFKGPTFGCKPNYNIIINENSNLNNINYSCLADSYVHPTYKSQTNEAKHFLAGSEWFQVAEIEVFQLH